MTGTDTPTPRVKCRILTVTVDGHSRHRILGLDLRHGQSLAPLDPDVRKKVEGIAARYGLDLDRLKDWWWYADASPDEPVPSPLLKHVAIATVNGQTRYRILRISLHHGQTHESLPVPTRKKLVKIATYLGLDMNRFTDWWWYVPNENGPPEHRLTRGDAVLEEGERGGQQYRSLQDPLDFYLNRNQLRRHQVRAGKKLYQLWHHGNMLSAFRVMKFDDQRGGYQDTQARALLSPEYRKAMDAIRGDKERAAAFAVCCEGKLVNSLDGFASRRSAQRHGMKLLRDALDDLAYHFFTPPGPEQN